MTNKFTRVILACLLLFVFACPIVAEREVGFKYMAYNDNNHCNVNSEDIDVGIDVMPRTRLSISRVIDGITAASRRIPIIDGVTNATAQTTPSHTEYRRDYAIGITQKIQNNTLSVTGDSSGEDDYSSNSFFVSWTREFNGRNNALSLAYSNYYDTVFPFGVTWIDHVYTNAYDLSFTSVLTPHSEMRITGSYSNEDGYLSNPYHRILINNFYFPERHPSVRDKAAIGLFYNLGLEGYNISSIQFDYRYYYDSWDVRSNTVGMKYTWHMLDNLIAFVRLRYYNQEHASFWKNSYDQEERFITADPKLGPFSAFLGGGGLSFEIMSGITIDLMYEQYGQYSNIDYTNIYQSVSKADLISQIIYLSTRIKL